MLSSTARTLLGISLYSDVLAAISNSLNRAPLINNPLNSTQLIHTFTGEAEVLQKCIETTATSLPVSSQLRNNSVSVSFKSLFSVAVGRSIIVYFNQINNS